jgi:3-oxoacyl-[acyl-carrier-protein] synthase-1
MKNIYLSPPALICCAGKNRNEFYESCLNGNQSGIKGPGFPTGRVTVESPRILRLIDAALEQIRPVIEKAVSKYGGEKIGVCLGSCDNGSEASLKAHDEYFTNGSFPQDYDIRFQSAAFPAEYIAAKFNAQGPVITTATACASGASAIIRGAEMIRAGICEAVIAGGADIVSQTVFLGFNSLEALSDSLTNPFSKNRKGINLGEAAAFFLLDSEPHGDTRENIELLGYGESCDAYHMTAPAPGGEGPAKAMREALLNAGIEPRQVGYVNLHGTGTVHNDAAESKAMRAVFKEYNVPASSTKPITGHTLGAAGALETAVCWMAINEGKGIPVHKWDGVKDDGLPFHPSPGRSGAPSVCMNNNFAFGGCNVSLIIGKRN